MEIITLMEPIIIQMMEGIKRADEKRIWLIATLILFINLPILSFSQDLNKLIMDVKQIPINLVIDTNYLDSTFINFQSDNSINMYPKKILNDINQTPEIRIRTIGKFTVYDNKMIYLFVANQIENYSYKGITIEVYGIETKTNEICKSEIIGEKLIFKKDSSIYYNITSKIVNDTIYLFSSIYDLSKYVMNNSKFSYIDYKHLKSYPIFDAENLQKMKFIKIIIEDSIKYLPPSKFCTGNTPLAKGPYERLSKYDKDHKLLLSKAIPYSDKKILAIAITYYPNTNDYYLYYGNCYMVKGVSKGLSCNKIEMLKLTGDNLNNWKIKLLYTFDHIQLNIKKGHKDENSNDIKVIDF